MLAEGQKNMEKVETLLSFEKWEDCKKWHDKQNPGQFIFRGLASSGYNLESTFDRTYENRPTLKKIPKWKYEAVMLLNFKRIAHNYVETSNIPKENDILEWMSLLRHYGAPSRLIDFSYSFYNAVYFAIEGAKIKDKEDPEAMVWAIDIDWLSKEAYNLLKNKNIKSKVFQDPEVFNKIVMNGKRKIVMNRKRNKRDFVIPINPFRYNRRLHLQQGLFLCPCNIEKTFEQNLLGVPKIDKNKILKIKLKKHLKNNIINDLKQMNISWETLYGDLQGVALSLNDFFCLDYRLKTNKELLYRAIGLDKSTP